MPRVKKKTGGSVGPRGMSSVMVKYLKYITICCLLCGGTLGDGDGSLQRKKRWLVFPKGSSLQLVYCFLVSTFGTRDGIFVVGITVGLAWEIPHNFRALLLKEARPKIDSRHRRELYSKIRLLLDRQGLDGMNCILRAICEAKRVDGSKQKFIHSLLHGLFSLPELDEDNEDYEDHMKYKSAELKKDDCEKTFPCPLDLFHFKP